MQRVHVVPFVKPPETNPELVARVADAGSVECKSSMWWLLDGAVQFLRHGLGDTCRAHGRTHATAEGPAHMALIVSVADVKVELRISPGVSSHDALLESHVEAASAFVARHTGLTVDDTSPLALRQAVILCVRQFYDGYREIRPGEAFFALIAPYRTFVGDEFISRLSPTNHEGGEAHTT